jgi:hypothetical protein
VNGVHELVAVAAGANSRVYRVDCGGRRFALKLYPAEEAGGRDRLAAEAGALELMAAAGISQAPRLVAVDRDHRCALLSWIDGAPAADPGDADVRAAVRFLGEIHALRDAPAAAALPGAAEACLSGAEIVRQLERRFARLAALPGEPELARFLTGPVAPALDARVAAAKRALAAAGIDFSAELDEHQRTLVPSDFGFHNALRRPDGSLAFVDFEYFGWDDPVKLTADFLLHPGHSLSPAQRAAARGGLLELYGPDSQFECRLDAYLPLFALRWALIALNEFIPARWRRRVGAGAGGEWGEVKARQLGRARTLLAASE